MSLQYAQRLVMFICLTTVELVLCFISLCLHFYHELYHAVYYFTHLMFFKRKIPSKHFLKRKLPCSENKPIKKKYFGPKKPRAYCRYFVVSPLLSPNLYHVSFCRFCVKCSSWCRIESSQCSEGVQSICCVEWRHRRNSWKTHVWKEHSSKKVSVFTHQRCFELAD